MPDAVAHDWSSREFRRQYRREYRQRLAEQGYRRIEVNLDPKTWSRLKKDYLADDADRYPGAVLSEWLADIARSPE